MAERVVPTIPDVPKIADADDLVCRARIGETFTDATRPYLDTPDTDAVIARGPEAIAEGADFIDRANIAVLAGDAAVWDVPASQQTIARIGRARIVVVAKGYG